MLKWATVAAAALSSAAVGANTETDPLSLQSATPASQAARETPLRLYVEAMAGQATRRYELSSQSIRRLSLDLSVNARIGENGRFVFSDRLDAVSPEESERSTTNSLRELHFSWRGADNNQAFDVGRINVRYGPAYGYNPTDFFRDGAVRSASSPDPFALRENRLGTAMVRYQRFWAGGSTSIVLAPKLSDEPSRSAFAADFGSTNRRHRFLVDVTGKFSDRASGQLLLFSQQGVGAQVGLSGTALLSDAVVVHGEVTHGRDLQLLSSPVDGTASRATRTRGSAGLTYTTPVGVAVTAEYQYNGFAPTDEQWESMGTSRSATLGSLLELARQRQDNASRGAWLVYASQKGLPGWKAADLTAFVRVNANDRSRFAWVELRHHWPRADVAVQWRTSRGRALSEFGLPEQRQAIQLLAAWYF